MCSTINYNVLSVCSTPYYAFVWRKHYGETDVNQKELHGDSSVSREASLLYPHLGIQGKKRKSKGKLSLALPLFTVAGTRLELVTFGL